MGSSCKTCLKDTQPSVHNSGSVQLFNTSQSADRFTNHVHTVSSSALTANNTSYYVSNQSLDQINATYLLIFTDSLQRVMSNPFIRELNDLARTSLEYRIKDLCDKVSFCNPGDYVNIVDPFPGIKISNLLVGWVGVKTQELSGLKGSIDKIMEQVNWSFHEIHLALTQISTGLGYTSTEFQKQILNSLSKVVRQTRDLKVTYLAYRVQNISNFIEEINAIRGSFQSSQYSLQSPKQMSRNTSQASSYY